MKITKARILSVQRFAYASLISFFLFATQACYAQVRYGINASQASYADRRGDFVDMMVSASPWQEYGGPTGAITVNASGYPTSSPSGQVLTYFSAVGYPSGTCYFYGEGDFDTPQIYGNGQFTLVPGSLQKSNNVTTCQFTMVDPSPSFGPSPGLSGLVLGGLNPNNPPNNIHFISPGYGPYSSSLPIFTNQFLTAEQPWSIVRGMCDRSAQLQYPDFVAETDWSTRVNPNVWGGWGLSFEGTIAYCNATMTDMWVMMPVNGTSDFSANLATLVHNTLNPKLHVYIEYCNECWNYGYPSWAIIEAADQANSALDNNNGVWGRHEEQVAFKTMQLYSDMYPTLGSQARFVMMGQMADMNDYCAAGLDWINRNYGPPSNFIYGIGGAAYIGPQSSYTDLASLFATMNDYLNETMVPLLQKCRTLANQYNLKVVLYEGGQGLTPQSDQSDFNFLASAQTDPGMATVYANLGAALQASGVDEMVLLCDCSDWNQYGYWGMVTDMRECAAGTSPKWNAGIALARAGAQSPTRAAATAPATSFGSHNLEAQPHAHNVWPSAPPSNALTKQQMAIWAAELRAKNAAKK